MPRWVPRPSRALAVALAAAALCGAGSQTGPPCQYSVQKISPLNCPIWGPMYLNPGGINSLGEWAGSRTICDLVTQVPVRWSQATGLVSMPIPSGCNWAHATGINDRGTVVGTCQSTSGAQQHDRWACIWIDGNIVQIPPLDPSSWSAAYAVNNQDWVVGSRRTSEDLRMAFVWRAGEITYIDPTPFGRSTAEALDVSNNGTVVGYLGGSSGPSGLAFRWKEEQLAILPPLAGAGNSVARSVNEAGLAVGHSIFFPPGEMDYAVPTVWGPLGGPSALPILAGYRSSVCTGVGGMGVVLGQALQPQLPGLPSYRDVVWIGGQVHELATVVPMNYPGALHPTAISSAGQITGWGPVGQGTGAWICTPGAGPADLNGDCAVDGADLGEFLQHWGEGFGNPADLDYSGLVDGADLGILLGSWTAAQ